MVRDNTCKSILAALQVALVKIRQTSEKGVTVIQVTANKSICNKYSTINYHIKYSRF